MASRRKPIRRFVLRHIAPPVVTHLYRRLASTWRYANLREAQFLEHVAGRRPIVGAFLHARTFQLLHYFSSSDRGRWILMCSQSRDGEAMAQVEERLGFRVARGSSGKGGARALVEMIKAQRREPGLHSCLAIDGSRGPRGVAQLGILTLAQKTGALLLPVAASASRAWIWQKSWDRTVLPKRGAEIRILPGDPIEVPANLDAAGTESLRSELECTLLAMHAQLDALVGFADTMPLQAALPLEAPAATP